MKARKDKYDSSEENNAFILQEAAVAYNAAAGAGSKTNPFEILGIKRELDDLDEAKNTLSVISYIRKGIPKKALDHLAETAGFTSAEIASMVHTSERTLRRYTPGQKLNTEQTERIIELALLYSKGAAVFEDLEQFKIWMDSPIGALGNQKPKTFLDTSMGIQFLTEELGRIEHGIFA
ncbi:antitoxin Xre-like helix-turn-helix domain-containing protein [Niabella yanshanensis]|uniref:Antitoxin Xre-like helix-turn-helix domain-containing protein n=1 Tax=Niabella yanshanensis TaxID=577386 RepID=A0ABZ0W4F4_9BACT|nr:antitoxin Xre-like helix-turn-helix domain-containing protein [Niabella yanshanensis]WQD37594.1 antitoxin Xre-like helix-turn-helix domain-containing protein [Niabella yanshanensis]